MDEELVLLEFKAGRLVLAGTKLQPDTRKGVTRLVRSGDGLLHIQWCERQADGTVGVAEDDTIVFAEEAVFEKASQTSQRVYILKFPNESDRNMFFWMQEVDASEDDTLCGQVNLVINTPMGMEDEDEDDAMDTDDAATAAAVAAAISAGAGPSGAAAAGSGVSQDPKALANMLSSMLGAGLQQAMHQHQSGGASGSNPAAATALLAQLAAMNQQQRAAQGPSLADILKPDVLAPLLRDPDILPSLEEHLPEGQRTTAQLVKLAHSSQFQQQLQTFSMALQTGQLDLAQFGLRPKGVTVADFLEAIQELTEREGNRS